MDNTPATPNEAPDPPAGDLAQYLPTNSTAGGVNPQSGMSEDLGGDPEIESDSVYDGGSLSLLLVVTLLLN